MAIDGDRAIRVDFEMNIWIQRVGIIFSIFIACTLVVILGAALLLPALGYEYSLVVARKVGWGVSALGMVVYALTWRRSGVEPQTTSAYRKSGSPIGAKISWGLALLVGVTLICSTMGSFLDNPRQPSTPGFREFLDADLLLTSKRKGIAHGNTPEAEKLAEAFSTRLKMARQGGIEARKSASVFSLSQGEFLTYCLLKEDRCVFLVHVPDLRKFAPDAKSFIADAAWDTALKLTSSRRANVRSVAVGLRGVLAYDRVLSRGRDANASAASTQLSVVKGDSDSRTLLERYFAPPAAAPTSGSPATSLVSKVR